MTANTTRSNLCHKGSSSTDLSTKLHQSSNPGNHSFQKSNSTIPTIEVNSVSPDASHGTEYSLAAKKLYRALSAATAPKPDHVIKQFLDEVHCGHVFSQHDVLHTLGVLPEVIHEEFEDDSFDLEIPQSPSSESFASMQSATGIPVDSHEATRRPSMCRRSSLLVPPPGACAAIGGTLGHPSVDETKPEISDHGKLGFSHSSLAKIANFISNGADSSRGLEDIEMIVETYGIKGYFDSAIEYLLVRLRDAWQVFLKHIFPYQEISLYLFICLIQIISFKSLLRFVPIVLSYLTFISMCYWTLVIFHNRRLLRQLRTWRRFLSIFVMSAHNYDHSVGGSNGDLEAMSSATIDHTSTDPFYQTRKLSMVHECEKRPVAAGSDEKDNTDAAPNLRALSGKHFLWANLHVLGYFLTSMFAFILSFALAGRSLPHCFFLASVSFVIFSLCIWHFTEDHNVFGYSVVMLNIFAIVSSIFATLPIPLIGRAFADILTTSIGGAHFRMSLSSISWLMLPFLYVGFLLRSHLQVWTYDFSAFKIAKLGQVQFFSDCRAVVRLSLTCFWLSIGVMLLRSENLHIEALSILTAFAVVSVLLFPSLFALALIAGIVLFQLRESLNLSNLLKAGFTFFIIFIPFLYNKLQELWLRKTGHRCEFSSPKRIWILIAFYVFLVVMSVSLLYSDGTFLSDDTHVSNLTWQQFEQHCALQDKTANLVTRQIQCSQLKGLSISWKGAVGGVRISKIDNSLENIIAFLPQQFAHWLRCFYGTSLEDVLQSLSAQCSLSAYNVYTLDLNVNGPWGEKLLSSSKGSVVLVAGHAFLPLLTGLSEGDVIAFIAKFDNTLNYPSKLKLLKVVCLICKQLAGADATIDVTLGIWSKVLQAFAFLFNFMFGPLITIEA